MGGKLFNLGRIGKEQYLKIEQEIKAYLTEKVGQANYRIPRYYAQKADFGDLDVLISLDAPDYTWQDFKAELLKDLEVKDYKSSRNIFSMLYQDFQVDFFETQSEHLDMMYHYLSFNDLGNLIGKIFHRFNLKYGQEGLVYVYRQAAGNYKKEKVVSRDFKKIIAFLELPYQDWEEGFDKLEGLFEWVISSPYFLVSPYLNPSPKTLKKIRERPTMQAFVAYLQAHNIQKEYPFDAQKENYLPMIDAFFPEAKLIDWIEEERKSEAIAKEIKEKFNGKLILALIPALEEKKLGKFIVEFKNQVTNFKHYVLRNSAEQIQKDILAFYQTFKHTI